MKNMGPTKGSYSQQNNEKVLRVIRKTWGGQICIKDKSKGRPARKSNELRNRKVLQFPVKKKPHGGVGGTETRPEVKKRQKDEEVPKQILPAGRGKSQKKIHIVAGETWWKFFRPCWGGGQGEFSDSVKGGEEKHPTWAKSIREHALGERKAKSSQTE